MKQIKAFIHHVRSAAVVEALRGAGYKNITLLDVNQDESDRTSLAGFMSAL
jgi:nitrogen regulatory protein PII